MLDYYVLFSSENCIYCYEMEETYQKAFMNNRKSYVYYVDLTNESIDSKIIKERHIIKVPLLVHYKKWGRTRSD